MLFVLSLSARGGSGEGGGGRGFRGGGHGVLPQSLGPYPYLTIALVILVSAVFWIYLRSRR